MDNTALAQIIGRIPELKYRYMGSFAANQIDNVSHNCFAIVNTQKSHQLGEHWILVADINGQKYYADSLGNPIKKYKNLRKFQKYKRVVDRRVQQRSNLCGLHAIFAAWRLYTTPYKTLCNINDVHVLSFCSQFL